MNAKDAPKELEPKYRKWAEKHGTPWEVVFPRRGAVANKRRFFATSEEAWTEISKWKKGEVSIGLGKHKVEEVLYCESLLPPGTTLREAVRFFIDHHSGSNSVTLGMVLKDYMAGLEREKRSEAYRETQIAFSQVMLTELGADTLFSTLTKGVLLRFIKNDGSYWNRYGRKRIASCAITKAQEMEAIKVSPLDGWQFERLAKTTPHYLKTDDAEIILAYAQQHAPELLPSFALQLYAGIRTEELCRTAVDNKRPLQWSDVTWGEKIIVYSEVSKTNEERCIEFWPQALTRWAQAGLPIGKEGPLPLTGRVCPVENLDDAKSKLIRALNKQRKDQKLEPVDFRQNDFRRTYGTNVCAYFQSTAQAKLMMGHERDSGTFGKHYKGPQERERAVRYFTGSPQARPQLAAA